jgi:uncharacterized protein with HEPN domain
VARPRRPLFLLDMREAIATARDLTRNRDAAALAQDAVARLALERSLEILSEASRHIPDAWKAMFPDLPWRKIADIGNVLRHAYWQVEPQIILRIVEDELIRSTLP